MVLEDAVASVGEVTFSYDLNGNMISGDGRTLTFDALDRPVLATAGGVTTELAYAPDGSRYRQWTTGPSSPWYGPRTVYYVDKDYELEVRNDTGETIQRTYVGGATVIVQSSLTGREDRYLHLDRLGSVDAVTTGVPVYSIDGSGSWSTRELMVDAHGYDPFGKPRARDWTGDGDQLHPQGETVSGVSATTDRGFTGHEHLDNLYLVHMNGRVYDYRLGRFLSVDPIISNPLNSQSINPYSYIGNNPLSGVDPTGYRSICDGTGRASNCCTGLDPNQVVGIEWTTTTKFPDGRTTTTTTIQWFNGADDASGKTQAASPPDVKSPGNVGRWSSDSFKGRIAQLALGDLARSYERSAFYKTATEALDLLAAFADKHPRLVPAGARLGLMATSSRRPTYRLLPSRFGTTRWCRHEPKDGNSTNPLAADE